MSFNRFCSIGHRGACERKGDIPRPGRGRPRRRRAARFRGELPAAAEVADAAPATALRPEGPCCAAAPLPRLSDSGSQTGLIDGTSRNCFSGLLVLGESTSAAAPPLVGVGVTKQACGRQRIRSRKPASERWSETRLSPKARRATARRLRDLPTQSRSASTPLRLCLGAQWPACATIEMSPIQSRASGRVGRLKRSSSPRQRLSSSKGFACPRGLRRKRCGP